MSSHVPRFFVRFIGHVTFELAAPSGESLLIDPFFGDSFPWEGGVERRLTPAAIAPEDIESLSAILVTHIHGDHYEPQATASLARRLGARVLGPPDVIEDQRKHGTPDGLLQVIQPGPPVEMGPWGIHALPNKGAEEAEPCLRLSYLIEGNGRTVFHSGDSHGPSPDWAPFVGRVDLALIWYEYTRVIAEYLQARQAVFMHYDRFEPGSFLCNQDPAELLAKARDHTPGPTYRVMERGEIVPFM